MAAKFFALLTNQGAAKLSNMAALGEKLEITSLAVGDGGGVSPTPNQAQTELVNERRRAQLNSLSVDEKNTSQIIAEQIIPESVGGWWIREIGLFDADGVLIAVANCPETYKATTEEGSGRTQVIRMMLTVSSTDAVTLKVDPSVVLATRQYVDSAVIEVKTYADNVMKKHVAEDNPHSQYPLIENALKELADAGLVGEVLKNLQLRESFSGVVGQSRNARMSVTSATQSATFTADELIVETSAGQQYRLSAFNKTVNLGATGAGGMDTGSVPSSGFIALYAILNPTDGATALLAVNATAASVPEIYGGANMPAGYTASALVSVWRVASGQFTIGEMVGRQINTPEQSLVTVTNTVSSLTELSISSVIPKNAKTMEGWGLINSVQTTTNNSFAVSSKPYSLGFRTHGSSNSGVSATFSNLLIAEPQKIYYQIGFGGTPTPSTIYSTGYSF